MALKEQQDLEYERLLERMQQFIGYVENPHSTSADHQKALSMWKHGLPEGEAMDAIRNTCKWLFLKDAHVCEEEDDSLLE